MSYRDWYPGQKVVHVDPRPSRLSIKDRPANARMPVLGKIYTIRDVTDHGDVLIVRLVELRNDHLGFAKEPGFNTSGFRPVQKRKTDISIFKAILQDAPSPTDMAVAS